MNLKADSNKIIYWLGRQSFLLFFLCQKPQKVFYVKKPKRFLISYSNQKFSMKTLTFFDILNKTHQERICTESKNYFIRLRLKVLSVSWWSSRFTNKPKWWKNFKKRAKLACLNQVQTASTSLEPSSNAL